MIKKPAWSILRYCALLVIGNAMFALGFNLFLVPNSLNVGGLSGIAMILQRVLGKGGIGLYTAVMNVPLFVIGYRPVSYTHLSALALAAGTALRIETSKCSEFRSISCLWSSDGVDVPLRTPTAVA